MAVVSVCGFAVLFTWRLGLVAWLTELALAGLLLWGVLRLREWAREALVVLGWSVSLVSAVLVGMGLMLPMILAEGLHGYWWLGYSVLWLLPMSGGLVGWLFFRRAEVKSLFAQSSA